MSARSADRSHHDGDHLDWQGETQVGKGEQHSDGKNNPVLLTALGWPLGHARPSSLRQHCGLESYHLAGRHLHFASMT